MLKEITVLCQIFLKNNIMLNKILFAFGIVSFLSCASVHNEKNTFNNYLLNDRYLIHDLKKSLNGNDKIIIYDSKNNLKLKDSKYNTCLNYTDQIELSNYILIQYTLNKDLAYVAFLKNGENKVFCFLYNRGKNTGKWLLIEKFEKQSF